MVSCIIDRTTDLQLGPLLHPPQECSLHPRFHLLQRWEGCSRRCRLSYSRYTAENGGGATPEMDTSGVVSAGDLELRSEIKIQSKSISPLSWLQCCCFGLPHGGAHRVPHGRHGQRDGLRCCLPRSRRRPLQPHRRRRGGSAWLGVAASVSGEARVASSPRSESLWGRVDRWGRGGGEGVARRWGRGIGADGSARTCGRAMVNRKDGGVGENVGWVTGADWSGRICAYVC
jgi:hypothetical protein|uniref:Uncharacterized protein n=1 Tax=Zea mays TaxID=4577 RepID=C4J6I5_MAIZE|nr:unknown [Zea mays]|eukprot:NP_001183434.1 uncharacterized protein LOC100501863 [Zea mays]